MLRQLALFSTAGILAYGAFMAWENKASFSEWFEDRSDSDLHDFRAAQLAFEQHNYDEVIALAQKHVGEIEKQTPAGQRWLHLIISAAAESKNSPFLITLFEYSPLAFSYNERASLIAANGYLVAGGLQNYEGIRSLWVGREQHFSEWYLLDVDKKLQEGRRGEAVEMLRSKRFDNGVADARRSIRLAALLVMEDPKNAWEALKEAEKSDPSNSDVYLYKGRLLNTINRPDLAINEYLEAVKYDPRNVHLWELLGDQYLTNGQIPNAIDAYSKGLSDGKSDQLWLKTYFWTKVAYPKAITWSLIPLPHSHQEELIEYYLRLPQKNYWDSTTAQLFINEEESIQSEPTAYWLSLLGLLQQGNTAKAADLLNQSTTAGSLNPALHNGLKQLIAIRQDDKTLVPYSEPVSGNFLEFLNRPADAWPQWVIDIAQSEHAYGLALLEADWLNSGLNLLSTQSLPDSRPDELVFEVLKAYQTIDDHPNRAIAYGLGQKKTPGLTLYIAQLYADQQQIPEAIALLANIPTTSTEGVLAKEKLLSLYTSENDWESAKELVEKVPALEKTTLGREVLAKQALEDGDFSLAAKIYTSIIEQSADAKGFLARKAYNEKDYSKAKKLTEQLIQQYPDSVVLKENLKKILQEQKNQKKQDS